MHYGSRDETTEDKRFWLSVGIFLVTFMSEKRIRTEMIAHSTQWADKFLEAYSNEPHK